MHEDALLCRHIVSNLNGEFNKLLKTTPSKPLAFIMALLCITKDFAPKRAPEKISLKTIKKVGNTRFFVTEYITWGETSDSNESVVQTEVKKNYTDVDTRIPLGNSPSIDLMTNPLPNRFLIYPADERTETYFDISLFFNKNIIDEDIFLMWTSNTANSIVTLCQLMFDSHISEFEKIRNDVATACVEHGSSALKSNIWGFYDKILKTNSQFSLDSHEIWVYALYNAELLRNIIIGDIMCSDILGDKCLCKIDRFSLCSRDLSVADVSPCCVVCLRRELSRDKTDPEHIIKKILNINPKKIIECKTDFNKNVSTNSSLPDAVGNDIKIWPYDNRPAIEYFNTVLYTIYVLSRDSQNGGERFSMFTSKNALEEIENLWKLIDSKDGNMDFPRFLENYLKQWQHDNELFLRPEWLVGWFVTRLFQSDAFADHRYGNSYSTDERLHFHQRFSTVCLYLLFWMRVFGDTTQASFSDVKGGRQEYLESLIHMLCEYAHVDGKLTRTARLSKTMRFMWAQQAVLYTVSEHYRDHLHHVLEVCLLGLFFMNLRPSSHSTLFFASRMKTKEAVFKTTYDGKKIESQTLRNWIVTSLLHDVGYALKLIEYPVSHLAFFQETTSETFWNEMDKTFNTVQKEQGKHCCDRMKQYTGLILPDDTKSVDHGVLSAMVIASHLNKVHQKEWIDDMRWAIDAAALHNILKEPIIFNQRPMAFLLHLCDNLQEWNRPLIQGEALRQSMLINIVHSPSVATHKNRPFVDYLAVNVKYEGQMSRIVGDKLKIRMLFGPAEELNYYPPLTWVGHTQQMQRIKDCHLPISITLQHPVRKTSSKSKVSSYEMDCFQAFLRTDTHQELGSRSHDTSPTGNAVLRQWAQDIHKPNQWLHYQKDEKHERVIFDLNRCDGKRVIDKTPDNYISKYIAWISAYRGISRMDEYGFI